MTFTKYTIPDQTHFIHQVENIYDITVDLR